MNSKINELRETARKLQKENYNLIANRRNPRKFGANERELERIWREIDRLEKEI